MPSLRADFAVVMGGHDDGVYVLVPALIAVLVGGVVNAWLILVRSPRSANRPECAVRFGRLSARGLFLSRSRSVGARMRTRHGAFTLMTFRSDRRSAR